MTDDQEIVVFVFLEFVFFIWNVLPARVAKLRGTKSHPAGGDNTGRQGGAL